MCECLSHTKKNLPIILLLIVLLGSSVLISSNIIINQTQPNEVRFRYNNINITFNNPSFSLSKIILTDNSITLNATKIQIESNSSMPVNLTVFHLDSNTSNSNAVGSMVFNFSVKCTGGNVWFNLSGFTPGYVFDIYKNNTYMTRRTVNESGVLSFNNSVWSWYYFTGMLYGGSGGAVRSDGSHLFYTCEDGLIPLYTATAGSTVTLDSNSSLEGKYCLNFSYTGILSTQSSSYTYPSPICPSTWSIKINIQDSVEDDVNIHLYDSLTAQLCSVDFMDDGTVRLNGDIAKQFFSTWALNTTYTIVVSSINYIANTLRVTVSNSTHSSTRSNSFSSSSIDINEFYVTSYLDTSCRVFFDDWTIGTQANITSSGNSLTAFNSTYINGVLFNDGSLLQNNSEDNHTVKIVYDTSPHENLSYTYYFNNYSSTATDFKTNTSIVDSNENTYGYYTDRIGENYTEGDDSYGQSYAEYWLTQTFTPSEPQDVNRVALKAYKTGLSPGIMVVGIRETDVITGKPTGADIVNGTFDADSLSTSPEWIVINVSSYVLSKDVKYAIVVRALSGTWLNYVRLRKDNTGLYAGGSAGGSMDYGVTWTMQGSFDYMFRIYSYFNNSIYLSNHTGNNSNTPDNNISKIEIRAKTNLSDDAYNGRILLQPIFEGTNTTFFDVFANNDGGSWSDWIDITTYINSSHPNWNDIRNLSCRVYANLTQGIAYVGMVQLRITCNDSYAFNKTITPTPTSTDAIHEQINDLNPGTAYFYRTYTNNSYYIDGYNYSSYSISHPERWFLTKPQAPTNKSTNLLNETAINISWTNGNGSNTTVLIKKIGSYPTTPYDGIEVYNSSTNYSIQNMIINEGGFFRAWSYTNWTHDGTTYWQYSDDYLTFNFSKMIITVYNESKPWQNISADIQITSKDGTKVYQVFNVETPYEIDLEGEDAPTGEDVSFVISNSSYRTRIYYKDITLNVIYNFSGVTGFYLPPLETPGSDPGEEEDCILRTITESISISNPAVNAVITTSHVIEEIYSVEIYNNSLYGSYGGWLNVPSGQYTSNTSNVTVQHGFMDVNTSQARVTYYYYYCTNQTISTALYRLRVVETISTDYTDVDRGVEGIVVHILRYFNTTGVFTEIAAPLTDANGYCNVWLIQNNFYKVNITDTLFEPMISDYTTDPPNAYGQTLEKIFRLVRISSIDENKTYLFSDVYSYNATMNTNNTLYVQIAEKISTTTNMQIYIYEAYNETYTLITTHLNIGNTSTRLWVSNINTTRLYYVVIKANHTTAEYINITIVVLPITMNQTTYNADDIDSIFNNIFGEKTGLSYAIVFLIYLPAIFILLGFAAIQHPGLGMIITSLYCGYVSTFVIFTPDFAIKLSILITLGLVFGVVLIAMKKGWRLFQ